MKKIAEESTDRLLLGLSQQYAVINKLIKSLVSNDLKIVETSRQELSKQIVSFGALINKIISTFGVPKTGTGTSTVPRVASQDLILLADYLDESGLGDLADIVDDLVKTASISTTEEVGNYLDENGFYCLADTIDKACSVIKVAIEEPIQRPAEGMLSSRYCPDHRGTQAVRIAEHIYQCPLDGKVYNYEAGYVNYKGQAVVGGSVAEQTPPTSDFGGIPMRIYDSRQNILNRIY